MTSGHYSFIMPWMRQRMVMLLGLTVVVFCVVYLTVSSRSRLQPALQLAGLCPSNQIIDNDILVDALLELKSILKRENDSEAAWQQTNNIIQLINGPIEENNSGLVLDEIQEDIKGKSNSTELLDVCPEEWLGPKVDHPYFFTSWKILECSNVLPFAEVLTIILYHPAKKNETCSLQLQHVLAGIKSLYPNISVLVSGVSKDCISMNNSNKVKLISDVKSSKPGKEWNKLIKHVSTPYVLVGRDMDDFLWTNNLERQVRMISYNKDITVAGGAVRNLTGHWRAGCWQATMNNYILEYKEGYYLSKNSCMFCDHLIGPFVSRTRTVKSINFDESLPEDILFEDWFWRVKQANHKVVACPDVMYLASDRTAAKKSVSRVPWMPLARKWGLNRIVTTRGRTFSYTCSEADLSCRGISSITKSFLMPICCVEQFAHAIGAFNKFCRKHNLRYELEAGSVLGVVKMNDLMPWDLDGDITFYTANMSFFKSNVAYFQKDGVVLKEFQDKGNQRSYFSIFTPDLYSEMWGEPALSHDFPLGKPFSSVPTQIELHGHWVYAPHSPGSYARNRYGIEILRHVQSWSQLGMKSSWEAYKSGRFKRCSKPKHHACLDHFSTDGNIQFQIPK